jgi:hypothetical protein
MSSHSKRHTQQVCLPIFFHTRRLIDAICRVCFKFKASCLLCLLAALCAVEERVGSRAHAIVLSDLSSLGDVRLLTIPATLKLCRRLIAELRAVAVVRGRVDDFPPIMQVRSLCGPCSVGVRLLMAALY